MEDNGAWDGNANGWWNWHDPVLGNTILHNQDAGSGPFKMVEWDRTEQKVTLERFDNYWRGPADIKEVIIWGIDEYSTRKAMLESGDADIVYIPGQYRNEVIDLPGVRVVEGFPSAQTTTFFMNQQVDENSEYIGSGKLDGEGVPPNFFEDIHVRKAFRHSFNTEVFINEVLGGGAVPLPTDLPVGYLGYSDELPLPEFSLKKATEEFKEAFGGELWEKGFELTLLYNTGNDIRQTVCEMIRFYVEQISPKFKVNVLEVQWPTFLSASFNGLLPAYVNGWLADYTDPHAFIYVYYHSNGTFGRTYLPESE
jgi:peptide/nickel transport system substrate-binding protein